MSAIRIERAGALTTVQDRGRPGYAHLGVPRSGAADLPALDQANALVGNRVDAAVLEATATGVAVRALADAVVAVTGADAPVWVGSVPAPLRAPIRLAAGQVMEVGSPDRGWRSYVAVRGGIGAEPVLGSRATDLLSGLGPAPLRDGDELPVLAATPLGERDFAALRASGAQGGPGALDLTVTLGPREDWFRASAVEAFLSSAFTATGDSNRVGLRLDGPVLERARDGELASEGMVLGAVQVPPSGKPVIFLADHPVTGGYPVIAVVDSVGVAAAAQARPGESVRFRVHAGSR
ncbi:biotin-dependent carboxyltransferase family protein [Demequina activiva]|uniref:Allophanate hydrolase n=1 Tax=Demequina activiva TaxID=1582364 RepID=A0A919Q0K9_9MICO|nr:biotin-dependent carboxyltransferase family protein [Demequina activiva]GIG53917.1 allophanate hydrolase [Demequina activiva]